MLKKAEIMEIVKAKITLDDVTTIPKMMKNNQ